MKKMTVFMLECMLEARKQDKNYNKKRKELNVKKLMIDSIRVANIKNGGKNIVVENKEEKVIASDKFMNMVVIEFLSKL